MLTEHNTLIKKLMDNELKKMFTTKIKHNNIPVYDHTLKKCKYDVKYFIPEFLL